MDFTIYAFSNLCGDFRCSAFREQLNFEIRSRGMPWPQGVCITLVIAIPKFERPNFIKSRYRFEIRTVRISRDQRRLKYELRPFDQSESA